MYKPGLDMGKGPVLPVLLRLSAPSMLSMLLQNLYALVDTIFVSWLGTSQLAALALAVPLAFIGMALSKGVTVGAVTLMSHAHGADDYRHASDVCTATYPLILATLAPLCLFVLPGASHAVFGLFAAGAETLHHVDRYAFWLACSFPFIGLSFMCEGVFLSNGDSRTPMMAIIAGNLVNLALDPLLIFVLDMGIAGASLASLCGWAVSSGIMLLRLRGSGLERPSLLCDRAHLGLWGEIVRCGMPVTLAMLVIPLGTIGLNAILVREGAPFVGAWTLSMRIEQMLSMPLVGLMSALVPFVGFNLGRGSLDRIREGKLACLKISYGLVLAMGIPLLLFIDDAVRLFSPGPEVAVLAAYSLRLALVGYLLAPVEMVMTAMAQGIKHSGYTLAIYAARLLVLRIPLALLLAVWLGGRGVYLSHPASMLVTGAASIWLLHRVMKLVGEKAAPRRHGSQPIAKEA